MKRYRKKVNLDRVFFRITYKFTFTQASFSRVKSVKSYVGLDAEHNTIVVSAHLKRSVKILSSV